MAQAAAQAEASASAASAMKSPSDGSSSPGQSTSPPPSLSNGLPRSLNDISQATQLYQRVGGAEMHIAMDTDLLGPIDLRAIVHQGSLSATIGVQRADVQTLLVNELPALQHSLSEKNMQVGQISVLAGSIGNGTNPNNQPHDQPSRQSTAAPSAPIYRDDSSPAFNSRVPLGASATWTGNSARLSVLA
jgi:flagellar hook-length control protein FliK